MSAPLLNILVVQTLHQLGCSPPVKTKFNPLPITSIKTQRNQPQILVLKSRKVIEDEKMAPACKRKSDQPNPTSIKSARVDSVCSASSRAATKVQERVNAFYVKYSNISSGLIDPEGIEALCSDLKVDHTDVRILMFAWKLKAEKQGFFTLDEWQRGLKALRVDSINKLKKALPELVQEVLKPENFEDFYMFAFRYCLTEEKQKCLDINTICILLDLVLGSQYLQQVGSFKEFLKIQSDYKGMNMDQWIALYRFCNEISFPNLQNYDSCEAWPLILDNFVEWLKERPNIYSA